MSRVISQERDDPMISPDI